MSRQATQVATPKGVRAANDGGAGLTRRLWVKSAWHNRAEQPEYPFGGKI